MDMRTFHIVLLSIAIVNCINVPPPYGIVVDDPYVVVQPPEEGILVDEIVELPQPLRPEVTRPPNRPQPETELVCPGHTITTFHPLIADTPDHVCCGTNYLDYATCFYECQPATSSGVHFGMYPQFIYHKNYTQCQCGTSGSQKPFCPNNMGIRSVNGFIYCCPTSAHGTDDCVRICEPISPEAIQKYHEDGGTTGGTCVCTGTTLHGRSQPEISSASSTTCISIIQTLITLIVTFIQLQ